MPTSYTDSAWDELVNATQFDKTRKKSGVQVADPTAIDPKRKQSLILTVCLAVECCETESRKAVNSLLNALDWDIELAEQAIDAIRQMPGLIRIIKEQGDPWVLKHKALLKAKQIRLKASLPKETILGRFEREQSEQRRTVRPGSVGAMVAQMREQGLIE